MKFSSEKIETIREKKIEGVEDGWEIIEALKWVPTQRYLEATKNRDNMLLKALWDLYLTDETANSIIVAIATISLGERFEITGDISEEEIEFWSSAFKRNWNILWEVIADSLVFGNSFAMITKNRSGRFWGLKPLFPLDVEKRKSDNGEITYEYEGADYKAKDGKIFECFFYPRSDSVYAVSLLAPLKNALDRKRTSEANIDTALNRHFPRFQIMVKRDPISGRFPTKIERSNIAKKFEILEPNHEFVTTELVEIKPIDQKGGIPDIEAYMHWFSNAVFIGARIPPEVLGGITRTTTYATAKARVNTFLSFIVPYYQRNLEYLIKTQIMRDTEAFIDIKPPTELAMQYAK